MPEEGVRVLGAGPAGICGALTEGVRVLGAGPAGVCGALACLMGAGIHTQPSWLHRKHGTGVVSPASKGVFEHGSSIFQVVS